MTQAVEHDPFQLAAISGKGGTGKTSVVAALAEFASPCVLADCDVDAPNLHLVTEPRLLEKHEFWASRLAVRDQGRCTGCGECERLCRFGAITTGAVRSRACEGCGLCVLACPTGALSLQPALTGHRLESDTPHGPMAHARLVPGGENSGRLVTEVRRTAIGLAAREGHDLVLIDGPPGIGCGVVATMTGTDLVLIVSEPTASGIHDLGRALQLVSHFRLPAAVAINKWDLSARVSEEITDLCAREGVPIAARIPFDEAVPDAMCRGVSVVGDGVGPAAEAMCELWGWIESRCRPAVASEMGL